MAKYFHGINGAISGKLGSVVGASWKGKPYLRSLPAKSSKPRSDLQLANQNAFGFVSQWLKPLKPLLRLGFQAFNEDQSEYNAALSYNLKQALTRTSEGYQIDYSRARFSEGLLAGASNPAVTADSEDRLLIQWLDDSPPPGHSSDENAPAPSDSLMYVVYFSELKDALVDLGSYRRKDGQAQVKIPADRKNSRMEVMIAFRSLLTGQVSTTQYLGGGVINP